MTIQNNVAGKLISIGTAHIISKCAIIAAEHRLDEILSEQSISIAEMAQILNFTIEGTTKFIRVLDALELVTLEAAYLISLKPAKEFTGNFCSDEAILREAGIDPAQYAVDPTATPVKDIFLPGVDYKLLNSA